MEHSCGGARFGKAQLWWGATMVCEGGGRGGGNHVGLSHRTTSHSTTRDSPSFPAELYRRALPQSFTASRIAGNNHTRFTRRKLYIITYFMQQDDAVLKVLLTED